VAPWPISDSYRNLSIAERQDKWFGRVDSVGYAVSSQSPNKELAALLAYTLSADEEVQRFLAQRGGQLPNIKAMAEGEFLTGSGFVPESRKVFVNMLSGQNGKRVPATYTFNAMWHGDGFVANLGSVWAYYEKVDNGFPPMSVADYCRSIQANAQELLDQAIADEAALNPNQ
jgi:multiple sugar transport system substrate-binding protein